VLGGRFAEGYAVANDLEQAQSRVFQAVGRIIDASPLLRDAVKATGSKVEFLSTGATIMALASDYAGAAGSNPTLSCFDELWGYTSERSRRLFDECVPPPTRKVAGRLTVTYAGFSGESALLEDLHTLGLRGEQIAPDLYATPGVILMYWSHECRAPWQTAAWIEQMRTQLRPNQFLRMIENRFVTSESTFVDPAWWTACEQIDPEARMLVADPGLRVWVGIDASVKRDSTAIVACTWDEPAKRVRIVWHRVYQPSPTDPIDFESTIEATVRELAGRFRIVEPRFDPYQMVSSAQRLTAAGVKMVEFPQSVPNLTEASSNLYELVKSANLIAYSDDAIRLAIHRAVALETSRGWRIAKDKQSHKIDVVVALAQAALGATKQARDPAFNFLYYLEARAAEQAARPPEPTPEPHVPTRDERLEYLDTLERKMRRRAW
jgi:phage terminase large subunit-like protein